jgi:hypothetical protein
MRWMRTLGRMSLELLCSCNQNNYLLRFSVIKDGGGGGAEVRQKEIDAIKAVEK